MIVPNPFQLPSDKSPLLVLHLLKEVGIQPNIDFLRCSTDTFGHAAASSCTHETEHRYESTGTPSESTDNSTSSSGSSSSSRSGSSSNSSTISSNSGNRKTTSEVHQRGIKESVVVGGNASPASRSVPFSFQDRALASDQADDLPLRAFGSDAQRYWAALAASEHANNARSNTLFLRLVDAASSRLLAETCSVMDLYACGLRSTAAVVEGSVMDVEDDATGPFRERDPRTAPPPWVRRKVLLDSQIIGLHHPPAALGCNVLEAVAYLRAHASAFVTRAFAEDTEGLDPRCIAAFTAHDSIITWMQEHRPRASIALQEQYAQWWTLLRHLRVCFRSCRDRRVTDDAASQMCYRRLERTFAVLMTSSVTPPAERYRVQERILAVFRLVCWDSSSTG